MGRISPAHAVAAVPGGRRRKHERQRDTPRPMSRLSRLVEMYLRVPREDAVESRILHLSYLYRSGAPKKLTCWASRSICP